MGNTAAILVLLACLVPGCALGTLQLSATVPENAHVGETINNLRSDLKEDREEVRCDIVAGNKNGRFRVNDCVIQVARPLDYGVHPSYNLTVNVTGSSGRSEQVFVDVQVQDVEGYPLAYNDTCETPIRSGPMMSEDFLFDMKLTGEFMIVGVGEISVSRYMALGNEFEIQPVGCPPNRYGVLCDQNCTCENGARCHGLNGACKCQPGWQGVVCDIPHRTVAIIATPGDSRQIYITGSVTLHCRVFHLAAERMTWTFPNKTEKSLQGEDRKPYEDHIIIHDIQSEHNGTYTCTVLTQDGTVFNASYELQAVACPPGKTGESCREECACSHGGSCDRWAGCVCPPGWTGTTCQTSCPVGTYGVGCSSRCGCQHDATCSPTDGRCNCTAGWFGRHCSRPCFAGRYGLKCWQACACKNNATCHHVDGSCTCAPPWTGKRCDVIKIPFSNYTTTANVYPFPLSLQIAVPVTLTLLVAAILMFTLYKWNTARHAAQEQRLEETRAILELRNMEDDLAQSLQPGWLNRWERSADDLTLDELVGLGAFAQIRRGQLRVAGADVTVAVKSVRGEDRRCYRAFCREVAALIAVHENNHDQHGGHPNIVKLFGVVTKSSPKSILLEFAAKGELLLILKQQPRPIGSLVMFLSYAVQISRALNELRNLRIAHGDVAARNVLVGGDDVAKLADFGLAHDVYTTTTYVSTVQGDADELLPLKWMALESLESREFTCESDTWSFGVLLWEIAAFGEEPSYQRHLSCPKLVGILRRGVRLERPPGCPEKLYDVMKSCWQEDPSVRPEPAELERELTECRHEMDPRLVMENENAV
ncbi:Endothelial cell-specific molecule 1 [Branchiostoma belcheri]|nr:Endothelial cell-specific molecule 1 [Branchiostoma belcheri]